MCKGGNLYQFLDLGYHPHSDQFRKTNDEPETRYPLRLLWCTDCSLVQLSYIVEPEVMYTDDYLYEASITATADKHWEDLVSDVIDTTGITGGSVIDIGGNDGTLALKFKERGFNAANIDPCKEVCDISTERGIHTLCAFFNTDVASDISSAAADFKEEGLDIVTGTNVFAHVHDLDDFMEGIKMILKPDGVFVFESPYLYDFLEGLEYDTVYHQHLSYLSLRPLIPFLAKHGMEVFHVLHTPLHGGGFRVYIAHKDAKEVRSSVQEMYDEEYACTSAFENFAENAKVHMNELFDLIHRIHAGGGTIACVSAPAKGMTMLNATGVGKRYIEFITEKSKLKIGRYTPGTKMKIVGDEELIKRQPDYALILAWNFAEEIMANNPEYTGTWIIPLPTIRYVEPLPINK